MPWYCHTKHVFKTTYETETLDTNVLYNSEVRKGSQSPPLADMFFLTKKGQLVLIDITDGGWEAALSKEKRLAEWIKKVIPVMTRDQGRYRSLHGVVLAPVDTSQGSTHNSTSEVTVVRGEQARNLLGGLDQVFWWMVRKEPT